MFNKKKDTGTGRAARAPSPAPPDMISRRRSAGAAGGLPNTGIENNATAHPGGDGTATNNMAGRLEANPAEADNGGGGTADNRNALGSFWFARNVLCRNQSPDSPTNASSVPATIEAALRQPRAASPARADVHLRHLQPMLVPVYAAPRSRTLLDPPSPPATGVVHTAAGPSIIRRGDHAPELGLPIVVGQFSDGLRTPEGDTPEPSRDGEEQPRRLSGDFRLSPEPREPESDADNNGGNFFTTRRLFRPAASNNPTPAHSQSGGSRAGSLRNALKGLSMLTPRRAPIPTTANNTTVTRTRRRSGANDALERQRGGATRRTQPIPIPVPTNRRHGLDVGRDGPGDLPEFHGRQRSATDPTTTFAGPIRSQPVGARLGAPVTATQRAPFGATYTPSSARTGSSRTSLTDNAIDAQPAVVFPEQGATWTPPRPPTPHPGHAAGTATKTAAAAFRTIAIDCPRRAYELTVALPGVRHGAILIRWGMRNISLSLHWIRKHISPASTPRPQQGSPEPNIPATTPARLVARGAVVSAAGASSGGGATIKDHKAKDGIGGKSGGDGKGNGGKRGGDKSGGNKGDGDKGDDGQGNCSKDNSGGNDRGEKEEEKKDEAKKGGGEKKDNNNNKDEDEDDSDTDSDTDSDFEPVDDDNDYDDDDDDEWTDIDTDADLDMDWSDCGEPLSDFYDSSADDDEYEDAPEAPLLPHRRGGCRR